MTAILAVAMCSTRRTWFHERVEDRRTGACLSTLARTAG
jgi:hypothetical protein